MHVTDTRTAFPACAIMPTPEALYSVCTACANFRKRRQRDKVLIAKTIRGLKPELCRSQSFPNVSITY